MTIQRMGELLEIERECVLRNASGECNRFCAECDLLQDDTELHEMYTDVLALLKEQTPKTMTLEEVKAYLADDDPDKNPLWVQWATSSVKGGWVLPHTVEDLMWRYESIYQAHWVLWTQKPNDEQKKTILWRR